MWDKIKEIVSLIFGSRLVVEGTGRTFVKVPMWLAVLACVASIRLAVLTALLLWVAALCVSLYDYHQAYNGWSETSIIEEPSPYGQ